MLFLLLIRDESKDTCYKWKSNTNTHPHSQKDIMYIRFVQGVKFQLYKNLSILIEKAQAVNTVCKCWEALL